MRARSTPGWEGYVVAVLVSDGLCALGLVAVASLTPGPGAWGSWLDGVVDLLVALVLAAIYVGIVSVPFALVGVPLVHLLCRRARRQWVHVSVAGAAGLLAGLAFAGVARGVDGLAYWPWMVLVVPVATAGGRAAVIPLCPSARTPVDDDSRRGVPAC